MDKDRVSGAAKKATGRIKQGLGKLLGDKKLETEGRAKKAEGGAQNAIGGAKDAAREVGKRR